jgi:alanyl-tRNA synthetase
MTVFEIRQQFFTFFESKGHQLVPSAPMVVKNDPTLMFTNAGMNQFKDYFLGYQIPKHRRIANSQKCLRVSGKHNDLEEVGVDTYHHTMFEMLGNWSFGDYFKEDAIAWAWELLSDVYKIDKDRLYVTVFEGDEADGVPRDSESISIWKKYIAEDRIILASKKDNFWEMGETGPCGPCTEIHVDLRSDSDRNSVSGKELVNRDHPQVIEIWNNVFMQFNRKADGSLEPLPETHVDTGMGLERLAMALQGKQSNYDTDLFQSLIKHMEQISGISYGKNEATDIALRVIADHIRTICFSIADGQLLSNNGAGYVIRRILRRAVRYGYQTLGLKEPFLCELSSTLSSVMGNPYSELINQQELIYKVIKEEELSFFRTLEQGIRRIDELIVQLKKEQKTIISGNAVFELYDTYGFPIDLTSLIARENDLSIDEDGFNKELAIQKDRSRAATSIETDDWVTLSADKVTEFVGYDETSIPVKLIKYRKVSQKQKEFFQLVFDKTPFYPEGGGQIGDQGWLGNTAEKIPVIDTKKENNLIVHLTNTLPKSFDQLFFAEVDASKRIPTSFNHSATHLLHHALRTVLGTHVEQKGSLVNTEQLRFDFSHFSKVTNEELKEIEDSVNRQIKANLLLDERRAIPIDEAKSMGAMALFGEKYGDHVRVIKFGESVELCGGIHVANTGQIGLFKILTEGAVAAGVRRIEAISGPAAELYFKDKAEKLELLEDLFKKPKDIVKTIEELQLRNLQLQKEIETLLKEKAKHVKSSLKKEIKVVNDMNLLCTTVHLDLGSVKDILFQLKGEVPGFVGIIGNIDGEKCGLSLMIDDAVVTKNNLNASQIIREVSPMIEGGGGGQVFFATAGGKKPEGIDAALKIIKGKFND